MIDGLTYGDYHKFSQAIRHIRAREMMDLVSIELQPWKKQNDQSKFIAALERDLFTEKTLAEMTTSELFSQLRSKNG